MFPYISHFFLITIPHVKTMSGKMTLAQIGELLLQLGFLNFLEDLTAVPQFGLALQRGHVRDTSIM